MELRSQQTGVPTEEAVALQPRIDLPLSAHLPVDYISHMPARLAIYQRLAKLTQRQEVREMQELSLIASPYKSGDHVLGVLGIVGPKRINYERMVALVDFTAQFVTKILTGVGT